MNRIDLKISKKKALKLYAKKKQRKSNQNEQKHYLYQYRKVV